MNASVQIQQSVPMKRKTSRLVETWSGAAVSPDAWVPAARPEADVLSEKFRPCSPPFTAPRSAASHGDLGLNEPIRAQECPRKPSSSVCNCKNCREGPLTSLRPARDGGIYIYILSFLNSLAVGIKLTVRIKLSMWTCSSSLSFVESNFAGESQEQSYGHLALLSLVALWNILTCVTSSLYKYSHLRSWHQWISSNFAHQMSN